MNNKNKMIHKLTLKFKMKKKNNFKKIQQNIGIKNEKNQV